jgi:TrmH family RNA methyltransferase
MFEKIITSVHNPRVKDAVRLRAARHRGKQDRIVIDGAREIGRALGAGVQVLEAFVCEAVCMDGDSRQAVQQLQQSGRPIWNVTEEVFAKLAFGERNEGVLVVAETPRITLADLKPRGVGPIAVIEGVEKPGNVGAILRSADAAGVAAVFTVPVCTATSEAALAWLRRRGARIFAARVDAQLDYTAAGLSENAAIVLGSEAEGLSAYWHAADVTAIRLSMRGTVDSLNVSATAAVLFYEAQRSRD